MEQTPMELKSELCEIIRSKGLSMDETVSKIDKLYRDKFKHTKEDVINAYIVGQENQWTDPREAELYYNETFKP